MAGSSNPFSSFFSSSEDVERQMSYAERQRREVGHSLTRVFLCTPSSSVEGAGTKRPRMVVALPQLAREEKRRGNTGDLDLRTLTEGLVERLQMADPSSCLLQCQSGRNKAPYSKSYAVEAANLTYLAQCYLRACAESGESAVEAEHGDHVVEECKRVIVEMCSPVLHAEQSGFAHLGSRPGVTFTELILQSIQTPGSLSIPIEFFYRVAESHASDFQRLKALFEPALSRVFATCNQISLSSPDLAGCFAVLEMYSRHSELAKVLVNSECWLPPVKLGKSFESQTLIGRLLSPSSLAPSPVEPSNCFPVIVDVRNREELEGMTQSVRVQLEFLTEHMHKVFDGLLRSGPESKNALVSWLVECLERNQDRGKMMSRLRSAQHMMGIQTCASDGFFLNLCWVMLRLAAPFAGGEGRRARLSSIDTLYCSASAAQRPDSGGALLNLSSETRLVPSPDGEEEPSLSQDSDTPFNFITHCFFLTHKALMLGMTQVLQNFNDLMRLFGRVYQTLAGITQAGGVANPLHQRVLIQFKLVHSQMQGCKAHIGHPHLLDLSLTFHTTTTQWLVWLATRGSHDPATQSCDPAPLFPLPKTAPVQMRPVPECVVDNMAHFVTYLRRSQSEALSNNAHLLSHLITFATVFIGSPQFISNPHLRATITQLISLMIPHEEDTAGGGLVPSSSESHKALFEGHEVASAHLIEAVMRIFVDIEYTGDSLEFEAKFQYRIPMYEVLKFVWVLPSYRASVELLSRRAVEYDGREQEMPILLRFINMIINDATVQLDEGLENLVKVRELQRVRDSEEWPSLSEEQKKEHQQQLGEATEMAKNRNLLAGYTVEALQQVTRDVQEPFVLPTMVDRIAAMLNYVLKQLVGPKRKELNVRDMEKYHFNPKELVRKILQIYVNLGQRSEFCQALPRDGRSFSLSVMEEAATLLRVLGRGELMGEMYSLIERVRKCSDDLRLEETALDDAPEEFLDPVTNELMKEPVHLPTSGVTMDKSNVIRHLLSDSTDPFNRAPLSADMLEPDHELRQRIKDWKTHRLSQLQHQ